MKHEGGREGETGLERVRFMRQVIVTVDERNRRYYCMTIYVISLFSSSSIEEGFSCSDQAIE